MSHRSMHSEPTGRGMWARHPHQVERFPSFAAHLPDLLDSIEDDATEEVTVTDPRGPMVQRPISGQHQNREGATGKPAPGRTMLRRPRPSPLFGEGELEVQPSLRATVYMDDRPRTLWDCDPTDPGVDLGAVVDVEESVTLEVDAAWKQRIRVLTEHTPEEIDELLRDDDLLLGEAEPRAPWQDQTADPAPIRIAAARPPLRAAPMADLADRAPAPRGASLQPVTIAPRPEATVGALDRLRHAAEAVGWFLSGFVLTAGTGGAIVLLVAGAAFAG